MGVLFFVFSLRGMRMWAAKPLNPKEWPEGKTTSQIRGCRL